MIGEPRAAPKDLMLAGGLAAGLAVGLGILLSSLTVPSGFKDRLTGVETGVEAAQRQIRPLRDAEAPPPGAICASHVRDAQPLADRLREAAAQLQLQAVRVQVAPAPAAAQRSGLAALSVSFEAEGGYDAAVQMLDVIGRQKPQVFVDTVDLGVKGAAVTLSMTGRAFCAS